MTPDTTPGGGRARLLTVSATYGAGGPIVARLLADRLALPFVDRLLDSGSAKPQPVEEGISAQERDEEPPPPMLEGLALLGTAWNIPVPRRLEDLPDRLRAANDALLRGLLDEGGAVVLGRAAAVVVGRHPAAFHVRLDGPVDRRATRGAAWEDVDLDTARSRLESADSARSRSVQRLYGRDPTDPALYHLVIDGTAFDYESLVEVIITAARAAWHHDDTAVAADIAATRARLRRLTTRPT